MRLILLLLAFIASNVMANPKTWKKILRTEDETFFKTDEARRIGNQVLLYQRVTGGWAKNIDIVKPLTDEERQQVMADKTRRDDSTTDNDATNIQMVYLARLYDATKDKKYRDAFRNGVEYLLSGQYANGGWPQFWPVQRDYQIHITYNDDAMVNTMQLLWAIMSNRKPYDNDIVDGAMKARIKKAFYKGVDCILATQIRIDSKGKVTRNPKGTLTVWCQQHDRETLLPAPARAYELPSYCSQESASIVALLMQLPNPSANVKASVHAAMAWFDKYKITGYRVVTTHDADVSDRKLVKSENATPIWARFYDLDHCEPYVCDRDGLPRRSLDRIGIERRVGYGWYGDRPEKLYDEYKAWVKKYDPKHMVKISLTTKGGNETGLIHMFSTPKIDISRFNAVVKRGESIQKAIEAAPKASEKPYLIYLKKGVYNEKVVIDRPNIVLVGENRDSCIIVGAETSNYHMRTEYKGEKVHDGILVLTEKANDCILASLTVINNYGTTVNPTTTHQFAVFGYATRTIILNSNIISDGNDALSLWAKNDGMYYHADLYLRCPGVDFICPRGNCYATRCRFYGDTRAILWHDGRGDKNAKFVVTNSFFDGKQPTVLGRYHHDSQFYIINCHMTRNIIDENIDHAYAKTREQRLSEGKDVDPCPWGKRVYYYGCTREGGHGSWLDDNLSEAPGSPAFHAITARWTFNDKWDPEATVRQLWSVLEY